MEDFAYQIYHPSTCTSKSVRNWHYLFRRHDCIYMIMIIFRLSWISHPHGLSSDHVGNISTGRTSSCAQIISHYWQRLSDNIAELVICVGNAIELAVTVAQNKYHTLIDWGEPQLKSWILINSFSFFRKRKSKVEWSHHSICHRSH